MKLSLPAFSRTNQGFTLIESLLYIVLFSIIIGGALVAVYQMIESSDAVSAKNIVEMEGSFLLRKIDWALTGLDLSPTSVPIISPALGATSTLLSVNKKDFGPSNPIEIDINSGSVWLRRGTGDFAILNSENIKVDQFKFEHFDTDGTGGKPAGIKASFYISAKTDPDKTYYFETTKYLRR